MALGGVVSFLACFLLFLHPIGATNQALAPIISSIWNKTCDGIYCGKGTCKASTNGTFLFSCECEAGWTQYHIEDYYFRYMPCVIPNCSLNYSCMSGPPPVAAPPPLPPTKHSIFDPCAWAYCGQGTCTKTTNYTHRCDCKEGYLNLLNVTAFPCFSECALGQDCGKMGATFSNASSTTRPSLSDNGSSNSACPGFSKNSFQLIMLGISLAMLPWI